jgi:hypothetical protein
MTCIVVYAHRYRRPPKRKPRALEGATAVVVHARRQPAADERGKKRPVKAESAAPPNRPPLPTIVIGTNEKRLKRLRAELRMAEPSEPRPSCPLRQPPS